MCDVTFFCRSYLLFALQVVLFVACSICLWIIVGIPIAIFYYRNKFRRKATQRKGEAFRIGIFHPYCNDGGGGEKVLWTAVRSILKGYPSAKIVIYTGDVEYSPSEILMRVKQIFNITFPGEVDFVYLHNRKWITADKYPYFTLLGQSLGSVYLGMEALSAYQPDLFIDTMGYAFTYPLFKYVGHCKIASYVHYPTITSDMLKRVSGRVPSYNNRPTVANSPFLTAGKLIYYKIFAWLYGLVGRCSDVIMVNSTWTEEHINELWCQPMSTHCVYPPCGVDDLIAIPRNFSSNNNRNDGKDQIKIISIGQFRPEKNHPLQLRALYQLRTLIPESVWERVQLILIGGCRNSEDKRRVKDMEDLCKHLSLENNVIFKLNAPYSELKKELSESTIGLHAMWNEHFGIGVVECLAAGLLTIAHRSGGPKTDIIIESEGSRNGFLAASDDEYAQAMASIIRMPAKQRERVILAARSSVDRFSVEQFEKQFMRALEPFLKDYGHSQGKFPNS
ncbi:hypothetical protein RUM43_001681 [Polyplax serrata]|uniref:GDP-Man:Man(3)GlcNAc(2)-PP-Dol alpha-1,2-mannosyltransferase n=1 Tax=Polyplax serrata TaxID=468196 RepID=A0AAN8SF50_POLSC